MSPMTETHDALLRRRAGALRPGAGARGPRRAEHRDEDVLRLPDRVRRRAEHPGLPDLPGPARRDAGGQRHGGGVGDPDRPGAELRDRRVVPLRAEELLLPGHAEELPDLAVRRADRLRGLDGRRGAATASDRTSGRDRARPHGGGHRQVAARRRRDRPHPRRGPLAGRLQPRRHPAHRDRHQADRGARASRPRRSPAAYVAQLRDLLLGLGVSDVRMEQGSLRCDVNLSLAPDGLGRARHPHRDQERQLAALGRAGGALRDQRGTPAILPRAARSSQETRHWHEDTGITTSGREKSDAEDYRYFPEPDLVPGRARRASGSRSCAPRCPSRRASAAPGCRPSGASPTSRCATPSAPGRSAWSRRPIAAGATPQAARKWWLSELARRANEAGRRARRARRSPRPTSRGSRRWSTRARSTTSWPARSSTACSPARAPRRGRRGPRAGGRLRRGRARPRPSTRRSPPTPTSPTRSATARSPRPAPSSAR